MRLSARAVSAVVAATVVGAGVGLSSVAPARAATEAAPPSAHAGSQALLGDLLSALRLPVLSGTGAVGSAVSLTDPVWNLLGVSNSYQWLLDGVPISGATASSYLPGVDDAGHQLSALVTGKVLGLLPVSVLSNVIDLPGGPDVPTLETLTATALPLLSGVPGVGSLLSLSPVSWSLPGVTTSVQWLRDGLPIVGATGTTYLPTASDAGHQITALVTGRLLGLLPVSVLSSAATIPGAATLTDAVASVLPTLGGLPVVGGVLTLVPGQWSETGMLTSIQWLSNGVPIAGATGSSLPLSGDLLGTDISALVTGTLDGLPVLSILTGALGVASSSDLLAQGLPVLTGSPKVASTLTAAPPAWSASGVTAGYQWLRNSVPIAGATSSTYELTTSDLAKQISVKVTGTKNANTAAATSAPVLVGQADALSVVTKPVMRGKAKPGSVLSVTPGTWSGLPEAYVYRWVRDGRLIGGATASQYVVKGRDAGHRIAALVAVPVTGAGLGYFVTPAKKVAKLPAKLSFALRSARVPASRAALATLRLTASGLVPTGRVRILEGRRVLATTRIKATDNGRRIATLPKLKPGTHVLRAVYAGNASTAKATSKKVTLRVVR